MAAKPSTKSEGPIGKIVVAVVIALLVGGTYPWWWTVLFPKATPVPPSLECSSEVLRGQLLRAGSDKTAVIKSTARVMRDRFSLLEFGCVAGLASVLLQDDQDNGHGLYFSGETWRVKAKQEPARSDFSRDRMREFFFRYLASASGLALSERDGVGADCYQREKGYCAERTAWINHLMAIDYYQQGHDASDKEIKLQLLRRASEFVKDDLKFGGFDQILPSTVLHRKIEEERQNLGGQ
jgi:hypothetical protein